MVASLIEQNLQIPDPSNEVNSEIFVARPPLEGDRNLGMHQASDFYDQVGVRRGEKVVDCIAAGSTAYRDMEASHHALSRALIFICWDLAKRATEDDGEWSMICDLQRWEGRHIKPKLSDDEGKRCHFIAHLIFSNETDCGDDGASKKGRAVEYLIRKGLDEAGVIDELRRAGGIDRIYKLAVAEFPRQLPPRRKSAQSARPLQVITVRKKSSSSAGNHLDARDCRQGGISNKSSFNTSGSVDPILFTPGLNERAVLLKMNKGDKLVATIECAENNGNRVLLAVSNIRSRDDVT